MNAVGSRICHELSAAQVSGRSKAMSSATTGRRVLVTGATGLLGSHIVERLIAQGYHGQGPGPAVEPDGVPRGAGGRCQARRSHRSGRRASGRSTMWPWSSTARRRSATGDRGRSFRSAASTPRGRSPRRRRGPGSSGSSTSARRAPYGHPPDQPTPIDETAPLGQNVWVLDHYTRSKVECERLLWDMAGSGTAAADGDPAELALRRARPDHDSAADPGVPLATGVDRGQGG